MCQAADLDHKMLPLGGFSPGSGPGFHPHRSLSQGCWYLLFDGIRPGGLNQKVLPDQDEDWKWLSVYPGFGWKQSNSGSAVRPTNVVC
jgi:hypothetical protein